MNYLFPNYVKTPSLFLLLLSIIAALLSDDISDQGCLKFQIGEQLEEGVLVPQIRDFVDTVIGFFIILFSLLVAFSKERIEDEYIEKVRLYSLIWATYINYAVLLILFLILYDMNFFDVMVYNLFMLLWIFIIFFNIQKVRLNKSLKNEK